MHRLPTVLISCALAACGQTDTVTNAPKAVASAAPSAPKAIPSAPKITIRWLPATVARLAPKIEAAADTHGVDANLLAIITIVESGGWTKAKSPSGAMGLMQVMPATANHIASERGISDHERDKLNEPSYNLDFGAWYIGRQLQVFATADLDDSVDRAAAAYNGGPGSLTRHLDDGAALSDETTRYRAWVTGMWKERHADTSATLGRWIQAGGHRLLSRAEAEMPNAG